MGQPLNGLVLKQWCLRGPYSGHYYFFIYNNDLSDCPSTNAKLFPDDASFFTVVRFINTSVTPLNIDLRKISNWGF